MALKGAFYGACCYVEVLVFFDEINAANCMALFKTIIIDRNLAVDGWCFFLIFCMFFSPEMMSFFLWNWEVVEKSCMLPAFFFILAAFLFKLERWDWIVLLLNSKHICCNSWTPTMSHNGETTQWLMNVVYRVMLLAPVWGKFWQMYLDIPCKSRKTIDSQHWMFDWFPFLTRNVRQQSDPGECSWASESDDGTKTNLLQKGAGFVAKIFCTVHEGGAPFLVTKRFLF